MYCVEKNTRNARPLRKSRGLNKPGTGRKLNPVRALQECADVALLGDVVGRAAAVPRHRLQRVEILAIRMRLVQRTQPSEHLCPGGGFFCAVFDQRNRRTVAMVAGQLIDVCPPRTVHRIAEARMIGGQIDARFERMVGDDIEL